MPPKPETFLALWHSAGRGESLAVLGKRHFWNGVVRTFRQGRRMRQMRHRAVGNGSRLPWLLLAEAPLQPFELTRSRNHAPNCPS